MTVRVRNPLSILIIYRDGVCHSGNIVWHNADDGFDVSSGGGSRVIDNISFDNGPADNRSFKVLRTVAGEVTFIGNVAFENGSRCFELRSRGSLKVFNNTSLAHPNQEFSLSLSSGTGTLINNAAATPRKSSTESSVAEGVRQVHNWRIIEDGNPQLARPDFSTAQIDRNFSPSMSIGYKVVALLQPFAQSLVPAEGSPLIAAGTFEAVSIVQPQTMIQIIRCRHTRTVGTG